MRGPVAISLVVSTLGREAPLFKLFESLSGQTNHNFEVVIVDQNGDDRLAALVGCPWPFNVTWIREPNIRGLSRARNIGWRAARGQILLFPDDDCWYPSWLLAKGEELMDSLNSDIVTGRAADELGRDINGRFAQLPHRIDRRNVWVSGIEWMMLFKKRRAYRCRRLR
ncbi:MAG: glycosyltransferase family A protein [Methylovirgula sp.]